jgi:protein-tyrosine phosphatase
MDSCWSDDRRRWCLAGIYAGAGAILAILGIRIRGAGLWLLWPAVSLILVASFYAFIGPEGFRKSPRGRMSPAVKFLLAPYVAGAWINSRLWTRRDAEPVQVLEQVWIGRFPSSRDLKSCGIRSVVDLTAELPASSIRCTWHCVPMLDLVAPAAATLSRAADQVERCLSKGPVLVCCALGYGRSAAVLVAWLMRSGRARTIGDAVALVTTARPRLVLRSVDLAGIAQAAGDAERPGG